MITSNFFKDFRSALFNPDQWLFLGWYDIKSKYIRTKLGPLWIVLVNIITIVCFSIIGSALFNQSTTEYLPHVTTGLFIWYYISGILIESCSAFYSDAYLLQNLNINPISVCLRLFIRNTISFAHSFLVIIAVLLFFSRSFNVYSFLWIAAIPIYALTAMSLSIILGIITTRYRDFTHIIQSLITIFPFVTPLIWKEEMLGNKIILAQINPVTHYVALLRDPLLCSPIKPITYTITVASTLLLVTISIFMYNKFRYRLVFWL